MGLPFQLQFAGGFFDVGVEAAVDLVDPDTIAIARNGDLRGPVDGDKVVVFDIGEKLTDVHVDVTLGALLGGVEGDAPGVVGPLLPSLGDGGGPVAGALFGRHFG